MARRASRVPRWRAIAMTQPVADPVVPVACPDCLSDQIKGPDQPGTGLSYWRCLKCGVVWNPERPPDPDAVADVASATGSDATTSDYWHNK